MEALLVYLCNLILASLEFAYTGRSVSMAGEGVNRDIRDGRGAQGENWWGFPEGRMFWLQCYREFPSRLPAMANAKLLACQEHSHGNAGDLERRQLSQMGLGYREEKNTGFLWHFSIGDARQPKTPA